MPPITKAFFSDLPLLSFWVSMIEVKVRLENRDTNTGRFLSKVEIEDQLQNAMDWIEGVPRGKVIS